MAGQRVEITLKFSADRDMVPGFGHTTESWEEYVKNALGDRNSHYNPSVEILKSEIK